MDLLRKSYPSVVLRSPPPAPLPSADDTKSAATQPPLYLAEGSGAGRGAALRGLLRSRGSFGQSLVQSFDRALCRALVELW